MNDGTRNTKDGWYEVDQDGSHLQLKHPAKSGKVTLAIHSKKIYRREHLTTYLNKQDSNNFLFRILIKKGAKTC